MDSYFLESTNKTFEHFFTSRFSVVIAKKPVDEINDDGSSCQLHTLTRNQSNRHRTSWSSDPIRPSLTERVSAAGRAVFFSYNHVTLQFLQDVINPSLGSCCGLVEHVMVNLTGYFI